MTWILIIFIATTSGGNSGSAGLSQEFTTNENCRAAGTSLVTDVAKGRSRVIVWGCYPK